MPLGVIFLSVLFVLNFHNGAMDHGRHYVK